MLKLGGYIKPVEKTSLK